jgi:hypothetical protein
MTAAGSDVVRKNWPQWASPLIEQKGQQADSEAYVTVTRSYGPNTATFWIDSAGNLLEQAPSLTSTSKRLEDMPNPTREEIDAKIDAAEARTDTKIARLEGKLDLIVEAVRSSRDEAREGRRAIIANSWVVFGALVVIIGILYTVAPMIFDLGFKWRETISKEVETQFQKRSNMQQ